MPELPEVENVKLSLESLGSVGQRVQLVELRRRDLRVPFPRRLAARMREQTVLAIHRRAKYLLFETEKYYLLSHLGMTGSWRQLGDAGPLKTHDHVILHFASGMKLVFNDPRRFGLLDLVDKDRLDANRWLKHLGVEPLGNGFNAEFVFSATRRLKGPIKGFLMDQKRVVGVGNIYASEALFAASIRPARPAGRLTLAQAQRLVAEVRQILRAAIAAGGSTIRDYRNSRGEDGSYQKRFAVYDREGEPCLTCGTVIRAGFLAGRNTFWCPQCQL